jgi:hypothetical protein
MYKYLYETNENNSSSNHLFILHFTLTRYQHCALKNKAKKNNTLLVLFTALHRVDGIRNGQCLQPSSALALMVITVMPLVEAMVFSDTSS